MSARPRRRPAADEGGKRAFVKLLMHVYHP